MNRGTSQRAAIIALGAITVILIGVSILVATRLQQQTSPGDVDAAQLSCSTTCSGGATFSDGNLTTFNSCGEWASQACATVGQTPVSTSGGPVGTTSSTSSTSSTGGSTGGNCTPNKSAGDSCDPSCGNNACDGNGPLGCNTCPSGTNAAGSNRCYDGTSSSAAISACGGNASTSSSGSSGSTSSSGSGSTGGGSKGQGEACTPGQNQCQSGLVCTQPDSNQQPVCNDPGSGSSCPGSQTCTRFLSFSCGDLTASGECFENRQVHSSASAARSAVGSCGQWDQVCSTTDQLCGDFEVIRDSCGGTGPTTTSTSSSSSSSGSSTGTTTVTTTTTYTCNTDNFTCEAVDGNGGEYTTMSACDANCFETTNPVCGDDCTTDTQCPNNHFCSTDTGTCTLNGCTGSNCSNGCSPLCGGPCDPNVSNACPTGHTCSTSTNTCVLNTCLNDGVNCSNGCTIIPDTALFDEENSNLLFGLMMILAGIILVRFNIIGNVAYTFGYIQDREGVRTKSRVASDRKSFENKFRQED